MFFAEPILKNVRIFVLLLVTIFENSRCPKAQCPKAEQGGQIRFPNFDGDLVPALIQHLCDEFLNHLPGNIVPLKRRIDGNVGNKNTILGCFINDETDNTVFAFGNDSEAVRLLQAPPEFLFRPGKFEARFFNRQNLGEVPANHPANVNLNFLSLKKIH
jgi:hypothetical protein